ncbi:hypothetical protein [Streptomyces anulatus]|nr:hypothetical protein [Streptomyces anulatus]
MLDPELLEHITARRAELDARTSRASPVPGCHPYWMAAGSRPAHTTPLA